jgi:hypothetical protein
MIINECLQTTKLFHICRCVWILFQNIFLFSRFFRISLRGQALSLTWLRPFSDLSWFEISNYLLIMLRPTFLIWWSRIYKWHYYIIFISFDVALSSLNSDRNIISELLIWSFLRCEVLNLHIKYFIFGFCRHLLRR